MSSGAPAGEELRAELERLAREVLPGGRRALERLLPVFARAVGGGGAVYLRSEHGLRREIEAGPGTFPEHIEESPASSLAFDGGILAWSPPRDPSTLTSEATALALAVAAAAREVQLALHIRRQDLEVKTRGVQLEALYDVGLAIASTLDF